MKSLILFFYYTCFNKDRLLSKVMIFFFKLAISIIFAYIPFSISSLVSAPILAHEKFQSRNAPIWFSINDKRGEIISVNPELSLTIAFNTKLNVLPNPVGKNPTQFRFLQLKLLFQFAPFFKSNAMLCWDLLSFFKTRNYSVFFHFNWLLKTIIENPMRVLCL